MAVSYVVHHEWKENDRSNKGILTSCDMTLTLSDDEGGGENTIFANDIGFKHIIVASNARNQSQEVIWAYPSIECTTLLLLHNPNVTLEDGVNMQPTGYNGTIRLVVTGVKT